MRNAIQIKFPTTSHTNWATWLTYNVIPIDLLTKITNYWMIMKRLCKPNPGEAIRCQKIMTVNQNKLPNIILLMFLPSTHMIEIQFVDDFKLRLNWWQMISPQWSYIMNSFFYILSIVVISLHNDRTASLYDVRHLFVLLIIYTRDYQQRNQIFPWSDDIIMQRNDMYGKILHQWGCQNTISTDQNLNKLIFGAILFTQFNFLRMTCFWDGMMKGLGLNVINRVLNGQIKQPKKILQST